MNTSHQFPARLDRQLPVMSRLIRRGGALALGSALACLALVGCASSNSGSIPAEAAALGAGAGKADAILEGDVLKISFVGAPQLDTTQEVRRDGRISLPVVGEVLAAGLAPAEFAKELSTRFASELLSNEVVVTVMSSAYNVNVSGAVLRPGKYTSKRPLTALEAVMEAGGFDHAKANTKRVVVVRHENGKVSNYVIDLSQVLDGRPSEPFYLKPSDIVYVPTRFVWF
jgi:polysaccharide export outer membrane protein